MTSERIKEIQFETAYPQSVSVMLALKKVWNECLQEQNKKLYTEEDIINALHSVELKDKKNYSKIYEGMKDWFEQNKNK